MSIEAHSGAISKLVAGCYGAESLGRGEISVLQILRSTVVSKSFIALI